MIESDLVTFRSNVKSQILDWATALEMAAVDHSENLTSFADKLKEYANAL